MKEININELYEIEIVDMGDSGEGIGKIDGFTVFVSEGIVGDTLEITIKTLKKNYGIGEIKRIIEPSNYRIESDCIHFPKCGGCQLRNMSYEGQLRIKEKIVNDGLIRIGGFKDINIESIIGMDEPKSYRNKCQYPVEYKNGKILMGFYERKSHKVENLISCHLQSDNLDFLVDEIRKIIIEEKISIYDERSGKGILRHVMIRESSVTGKVMVVFVINSNRLRAGEKIVNRLTTITDIVETIVINKNTRKGNRILGDENIILYGNGKITDKIGDLNFEISPLSFFQINKIQTEKLYEKVLEYGELKGGETVLDIYCGIGTISLFLAKSAKMVYGIEIIPDAVKDAKKNADLNGIKNVEFLVGKAEEKLPKLCKTLSKIDLVVVDPPRKGCEREVLDTILTIKPKKVVYVSCKPSTLARDLKYLCESGKYEIKKVQPVDMFPWTGHVETVVLLSHKNS